MSSGALLAAHSTPPLVCYVGLVALLLRQLVAIQWVRLARRKRLTTLTTQRPWVALIWTWHMPLLSLGLAIATTRIAFFLAITTGRYHQQKEPQWLLWLGLEVPSALLAILAGYLVLFHAHLVHFRAWPMRFHSFPVPLRLLFIGVSGLLATVVALLAYLRAQDATASSTSPLLMPQEWATLELSFFAIVWIIIGAVLLKYQGDAADLLWTERDANRLLVVGRRGIHTLLVTQTTLALLLLLRGTMLGMLAANAATVPVESRKAAWQEPLEMTLTSFVAMYGVWELLALLFIYALCSCVPAISRTQRLTGLTDSHHPSTSLPVISDSQQPVGHVVLAIKSPKQAVVEYMRSATMAMDTRASRRTGQRLADDEPSSHYDCIYRDDNGDREGEEGNSLATAWEPLLSQHESCDHETERY